MDCLALETSSSAYDHISSFLEDFQDKNSHLFPSTDLYSLDVASLDGAKTLSCGSKRSRETSYDSFSSWNDDLLSDETCSTSTVCLESSCVPIIKQEKLESSLCKQERPIKMRKLSVDDELSIFMSDARSRSPPFQTLDYDNPVLLSNEVLCAPLPPAVIPSTVAPASVITTPPTPALCKVLGSIGNLNDDIRKSMFASLTRLASRAATGRNVLQMPRSASVDAQIESSMDYLTMQTIYGAPPSIIKPEPVANTFYPATGGIPFVLNVPYVMPTTSVPLNTVLPKCTDTPPLVAYSNMYASSKCTKPTMIYSEVPSPMMNQLHFVTPSQSVYSHQSVIHV